MTKLKKAGTLFGGLLAVGFIITMGISGYVAQQLTHPERRPITQTPEDYNLAYQDIQFSSRVDSLQLKGWLIPADSATEKIVIEAHGYRDNRSSVSASLPVAQALQKQGIAVMMFDFRAEGVSPGNIVTGGLHELRDLLGAVDYARAKGFTDIGLLGFSMGATTTIRAAGEDTLISAIVADGPFTSQFYDEQLYTKTHLPNFPFTPQILWSAEMLYDIDLTQVAAEKTLSHWKPRPTLLIAGTADQVVPASNTRRLYNEIKDEPNTDFWVVEGARHIRSFDIIPEEYTQRVVSFFATYL